MGHTYAKDITHGPVCTRTIAWMRIRLHARYGIYQCWFMSLFFYERSMFIRFFFTFSRRTRTISVRMNTFVMRPRSTVWMFFCESTVHFNVYILPYILLSVFSLWMYIKKTLLNCFMWMLCLYNFRKTLISPSLEQLILCTIYSARISFEHGRK